MSRSCTPKAGSAGARVLVALWVLFAAGAVAVTSEPTSTGVLGRAPDAESLEFEPTSVYGVESKDVKLKYQFNDPDGDEESGSLFSWATADATGTLIDLGSAASVPNVPEAAINQPLTACVTPKTDGIRTAPATGKQACITTTVQPPAPLVKDVVVKVKEADGLFLDTNNLSATYTWEGVGNDTSIYAYGPTGQSAALLQTGGGNTNAGTIPDFSLAGYAGKKLELSIKPQSHYGGVGSTVTTSIDGYVYNPNLPPLIADIIQPSTGLVGGMTPVINYLFDRAGGADGDNSTFDFYLDTTLVSSGKTDNGKIPPQSIPAGVYGRANLIVTPVNGLGVTGEPKRFDIYTIYIIDPNSKPVVSEVKIRYSTLAAGEWLDGGYLFTSPNSSDGPYTRYAWREYRNDSAADKLAYINSFGANTRFPPFTSTTGKIGRYLVPAAMIGKQIELLVYGRDNQGRYAERVETSGPTPTVPGGAPSVNPSAKPSIALSSLLATPYSYTTDSVGQFYYTFSPNGGGLVDRSVLYLEGVNILTGAKANHGLHYLGQGVTALLCSHDEVLSLTLEPINSLGVKGDRVTITTADLGLGPSGLGYCYDSLRVSRILTPTVTFASSDKQLFVGGELRANYQGFDTYPGMYDISAVSWNGGPFVYVTTPGVVPPYTIKPADVGKPVSLSIRFQESDKKTVDRIDSVTRIVDYSTNGFLSGIVLEP